MSYCCEFRLQIIVEVWIPVPNAFDEYCYDFFRIEFLEVSSALMQCAHRWSSPPGLVMIAHVCSWRLKNLDVGD